MTIHNISKGEVTIDPFGSGFIVRRTKNNTLRAEYIFDSLVEAHEKFEQLTEIQQREYIESRGVRYDTQHSQ